MGFTFRRSEYAWVVRSDMYGLRSDAVSHLHIKSQIKFVGVDDGKLFGYVVSGTQLVMSELRET